MERQVSKPMTSESACSTHFLNWKGRKRKKKEEKEEEEKRNR
jgi:hypothetical protein